jgi:hypothetical protein
VTTSVTGRALAGLHRSLLRGVVYLALLPLRAVVALLVWLGMARVAATVLFVGWAEPIVGLRSAGWLVVIWWVHRLTRHKRAELYRHELLRRAEHALERQPTALLRTAERALGRQVVALTGATRPRWPTPRPPAWRSGGGQRCHQRRPQPTTLGWLPRHSRPPTSALSRRLRPWAATPPPGWAATPARPTAAPRPARMEGTRDDHP